MARSNDEESARYDIVALARRHIGMGGRVFYAPLIPRDKEVSARFAHDLHLPDDEAILVLHDGTVFGSAEEGFLVTKQRLCWKNSWEHAKQVAWSDLDPSTIKRDVGKVLLQDSDIAVSGDLVLGVSRFLVAMTGVARGGDLGPYRGAALLATTPEILTLPEERIVALARSLVGDVLDVFYAPRIPRSKLHHARRAHAAHLSKEEPVAVLYDDTIFGSAEEGFLLTSKRLCWKLLAEPAIQLPWGMIDSETISGSGSYVEVMGAEIKLSSRDDISANVATLLQRIIEEARVSAGKP
jgi:hypothetical protein